LIGIIQGSGVEVKRRCYQFFELNEENERRHFKKMRVSQNSINALEDGNFTSTPFGD